MARRRGVGPVLVLGLLVAIGAAAYVLLTRDTADEAGPVDGTHRTSKVDAGTGPTLEGQGPGKAGEGASASRGPGAVPAATPEDPESTVLIGRVVDASRRPVAGAAVTARVDGYPDASGWSGADGKFRVPLGPPTGRDGQGFVHVVSTDGRAALAYAWVGKRSPTREVHVGVITLLPAGSLLVHVEREGRPVAEAQVSVRATAGWMPTRVALVKSDARGEVRLLGLPPGSYRAAALAPGHGRAVGVVQVNAAVAGAPPAELRLALTAPRTVEVLVLDKGTEAPVAGATLSLDETLQTRLGHASAPFEPPLEVAMTDATGKTRIEGLGSQDMPRLSATAPGYSGGREFGPMGRPVTLAADATEARLLLEALVPLRWPIKAGDPLAPPDGTRLPLEPDPGAVGATLPKEVRVEGGFLVAEGFSTGPIHAFAVAADGAYAKLFRLPNEADGREVSFQRPRRIDVHVVRADGTPATGLFVSARSQGNNPLGDGTPLDAEGRAVLLLKHPYLVEVYGSRSRDAWTGSVLGTADLRTGDARVEGTVSAERDVLLSIRLQGKPGLPGSFTVGGFGQPTAEIVAEDPDAGTLLLRLALPAPLPDGKAPTVWIQAVGFAPATAEVSGFEGEGALRASVDLEPAGSLRVRVKTPADKRGGRPLLQRFDAGRNAWAPPGGVPPGGGQHNDEGPEGYSLLNEGLTAGRYRFVVLDCGEMSAAVEVRGGVESEVLLDLSRSGPVTGTIEVPEGFDASRTTLTLDVGDLGRTFGEPPGQGFVQKNGSFSVRVPGSRPVTLRVKHPLLKPDAASAALVLERPQEGLRVRLVQGATARFTLPGVTAMPSPGPRMGGLRVLLFSGAPGEKPLLECSPELAGSVWSFGGYEPGTYTLWIDTESTAPLELRGVVLGEAVTELGAQQATPGTTVRIRVKGREGTAVPRLSIWAQHLGEPRYSRGVNSRGGPDDVLIAGLGAGRFRVTGGSVMGMGGAGGAQARGLDQTIEVDGTGEVVIDYDLR